MNINNGAVWKVLATLLVIILFFVATLLIATKMICSDISQSAKEQFISTLPEAGIKRSAASLFVSDEEMQLLSKAGNSISKDNNDVTNSEKGSIDDIELKEISGPTFYAKMLIVKDPSRIKLSTIYPWRSIGVTVDELVKMADAVGGINSGLYVQGRNTGGRPQGIVVCNGEILNNNYAPSQQLIGMDNKNVLRIINLAHKSPQEVEEIVRKEGIRDAVCFPEEHNDASNWMVNILLDGEKRRVQNGLKCCINPRTVIAQRADGAILLLATDGRGAGSHIGATAVDLIRVMKENGAVTAANLDGGSSTCMYYDGEYVMGSTTFYHAKSSWNFPTAFVISKK